ncbi:peptidoglycan-binding protein [Enterovibrio norvegicus]|uniref:LysM peptidoglycan-binding domain-containing protein n=1 Tax=Enterovibrio norvegicus TaxID=188144 RepID=UPI000C818E59|nr:LysM domain-containing protein [Enterovibrio norvegicus]MCC4800511.1 LysM peptidoglycan-binding domain-containing protein [Enterovibrio norvegicus]PMI32120.1 peptidoglycan-binding protein [Enterovibrio norvegicus]PMI37913.1 peptidoglycan-binding protein [Enterovibrio norvegicus]PMN51142.1 peptidoglycan-binding protein [Enterovibrio norvegicus]TKF12331.1 LysM peptidoglycan-binding domain-containing protein [Enterovibrio norvegicus]
MFKKLIIVCMAGMLSATSMANVISLSDDAPDAYQVRKGDTLWDIAGLYLDKPWHWPALWQQNPDIENPHLIYPGDELRLSWQDGQPVLTRKAVKMGDTTPISGVSTNILKQYLTYDTLMGAAEVNMAPRVLGNQKGWSYITTKTPFYVDAVLDHDEWFIYRPVTTFDRQVGEETTTMISLNKVAEARLVRNLDEIAELKLVHQSQEVKPNDILLPSLGARTGEIFQPHAAPSDIAGNLVGHLYGSKYVGLRQIVVVNRGETDGLDAGHALSVMMPGAALKGKKGNMRYDSDTDSTADSVVMTLPDRHAGTLLVIRSYPHFSLAMVVDAEQPLSSNMNIISAGGS